MSCIPRVSVVITCYNYGRYLSMCVDSVLRQTQPAFEVIVVDDGSTDETPQVAARFAETGSITYIQRENGGQAAAKNTGIKAARGELIAFLDADDAWERTKLAKQLPLFEDPAVGVVYSNARWIDEAGNPVVREDRGKYLRLQAGRVTDRLFHDNFVWFSSSVVRRSCLDELGAFDESLEMGIDWDLWLRISTRYAFAFVDEPLLDYRIGHSQQMSRNLDLRYASADRIMDRFISNYPHAVSPAACRNAYYVTLCNRAAYLSRTDTRKALGYLVRAFRMKPFDTAVPIQLIRMVFGKD